MNRIDPRLAEWVAQLRRGPEPRPAAIAGLRTALRREHGGDRSPQPSLFRRGVVLTPARAAAAVVAVVAVTSLLWYSAGWMVPYEPEDGAIPVQFVLHADDARTVSLVGDFNDWDPDMTPLEKTGGGVWSVVVLLRPGAVRYSFLIDGREWRGDPGAAAVASDFGRPTSLAMITDPEMGR